MLSAGSVAVGSMPIAYLRMAAANGGKQTRSNKETSTHSNAFKCVEGASGCVAYFGRCFDEPRNALGQTLRSRTSLSM
jgi:hypothetical protein